MTCQLYVLDNFRPCPALSYKDQLKDFLENFLSEDDYQEFLVGLTDFDVYETMDEELKLFINTYYNEDVPIHCLVNSTNEEMSYNA